MFVLEFLFELITDYLNEIEEGQKLSLSSYMMALVSYLANLLVGLILTVLNVYLISLFPKRAVLTGFLLLFLFPLLLFWFWRLLRLTRCLFRLSNVFFCTENGFDK